MKAVELKIHPGEFREMHDKELVDLERWGLVLRVTEAGAEVEETSEVEVAPRKRSNRNKPASRNSGASEEDSSLGFDK